MAQLYPEPEYLPVRAGAGWTGALDIDEDGTIVGNATGDTTGPRAHVWRADGTLEESAKAGDLFSIRNGWISGVSEGKPVRWNHRTGVVEPLAGELHGASTHVNAHGWVIGATRSKQLQMVSADRHVALPALDAWRDGEARAVYVAGVFEGTKEHLASAGVVWRCS